jgi:hypothetical protein
VTIAEPITIIEVTRRQPRTNAAQLMNELISNRYCLGLLRFFVMHPNGRFSKLAIVHALDEDGTRPEVNRDLDTLVNNHVVYSSYENGTWHYQLTHDEPTRHLALNLADFDWRQWQRLDHYYVADRRIPA